MSKIYIKKGDNVIVTAGDSKGKTGKVLRILTDKNAAIVENVNLATKHAKASAKHPNGGIIKTELPIHISNLMLMADGKATRIKMNSEGKDNKKVRLSKKTGEVIK